MYHLFGMSDGIEVMHLKKYSAIETADSSSPIIHGWNKVRYTAKGLPGEKIAAKMDFAGTIPKERKADILFNIKKIKEWAK